MRAVPGRRAALRLAISSSACFPGSHGAIADAWLLPNVQPEGLLFAEMWRLLRKRGTASISSSEMVQSTFSWCLAQLETIGCHVIGRSARAEVGSVLFWFNILRSPSCEDRSVVTCPCTTMDIVILLGVRSCHTAAEKMKKCLLQPCLSSSQPDP